MHTQLDSDFTRAAARAWVPALLALALAGLPEASRAQGVHVMLTPVYSVVSTGANFEIDLTCTQAGSGFNAFDVTVGWDPAALTLVPTAPASLQEGSTMTGGCAQSPFHKFTPFSNHMDATVSLLCNGVSLPGPGQLYRLHFLASNTPQLTVIHIQHAQFYNAGINVAALDTVAAEVNIGNVVGVPPGPRLAALRLRASPSPFRLSTILRVESPAAGPQSLVVYDLEGRPVRHLQEGAYGAGSRQVAWDGSDDAGRAVAAGIYVAQVRAGAHTAHTRVALIR